MEDNSAMDRVGWMVQVIMQAMEVTGDRNPCAILCLKVFIIYSKRETSFKDNSEAIFPKS